MAKKTKKKASPKPRPKLTNVRKEMTRLRDDLKVIIAEGEDQQGPLSSSQMAKAQKTKDALDAALKAATCGQLLSAY